MPTLTLNTPPDFHFWPTAVSHGWCDLPPFRCDEDARVLEYLLQLSNKRIVRLVMHNQDFKPGVLTVKVEGIDKLSAKQTGEIRTALSHCLEIERDRTTFHSVIGQHPRYTWIETVGAGRMLASPTVWEDLAKTLFTTNTIWRATIGMCQRMVTLGDVYRQSEHAFPTPQRIAVMRVDDLNTHIRAGYRSAYLHLLASRIASGEIDVESWRDPVLTSQEVYQRIRGLKGFGDYAAGNMLRLLGHFDRLATDTVCREVYKTLINNGTPAKDDKEIAAYYEPFGQWRGLAQWMDVMEPYYKGDKFRGQ